MMRGYLGDTLGWKKDFDGYECSCWTWNISCSIITCCMFLELVKHSKIHCNIKDDCW